MVLKRHVRGFLPGLLLALSVYLAATPTGAAMRYAVNTNPYIVDHTLPSWDPQNAYALTAAMGDTIAYSFSVTTPDGCSGLALVKGHSATPDPRNYVDYTGEGCIATSSSTFIVPAAAGTRFSVVMFTRMTVDISYTLMISVTPPLIPPWASGLAIVVGLFGALGVVGYLVWRWRVDRWLPPAAPPDTPTGPRQSSSSEGIGIQPGGSMVGDLRGGATSAGRGQTR